MKTKIQKFDKHEFGNYVPMAITDSKGTWEFDHEDEDFAYFKLSKDIIFAVRQ